MYKAIPISLSRENFSHYKILNSLEHVVSNNPYEFHLNVKSILRKGVSINTLSIITLRCFQIEEWKYGG